MTSFMTIEDAITHAYKNPERNIIESYTLICLSIIKNVEVLVPVIGSSSYTWEHSLSENAQDFLLTDCDGSVWFPVFTDASKLGNLENSKQLQSAKLKNILLYVYFLDNVSGLVFNPYSLKMLLPKKIIELLFHAIFKCNTINKACEHSKTPADP